MKTKNLYNLGYQRMDMDMTYIMHVSYAVSTSQYVSMFQLDTAAERTIKNCSGHATVSTSSELNHVSSYPSIF